MAHRGESVTSSFADDAELLAQRTLAYSLASAEEKKQLGEQLAGLESKDALTNDEARAKLDALTKLLEPHKEALQSAGFLWPGQPPPGAGDANANPLKDHGRLKSLQSSLGK